MGGDPETEKVEKETTEQPSNSLKLSEIQCLKMFEGKNARV